MVEVIVGSGVIGHVGEDDDVLAKGEDRVDTRLTVDIVSPEEIHGDGDGRKMSHQQDLQKMLKSFMLNFVTRIIFRPACSEVISFEDNDFVPF